MTLEIATARSAEDIEHVRTLCREFEAALRRRYEAHIWLVETYIEPESWFEEMRDIEKIYAPPEGAVLLARVDGAPAGFVMMRKISEGICEMKRLFVRETARGADVGRHLSEKLIEIARECGYRNMCLDVGFRQVEARALYASLGFKQIPPYKTMPKTVAELLDFMELEL